MAVAISRGGLVRGGREGRPWLLLLAWAAGCGGGAGAPCETDDDCAPGLSCRGKVCLPVVAGDGEDAGIDGRPDWIDSIDGVTEADGPQAEDAAGDEGSGADEAGDGDGDDAGPVLAAIDPGETSDVADPARPSGVFGEPGEEYVLLLWENGLAIWDRFDVAVDLENGRKSASARLKGGPFGAGRVVRAVQIRLDSARSTWGEEEPA